MSRATLYSCSGYRPAESPHIQQSLSGLPKAATVLSGHAGCQHHHTATTQVADAAKKRQCA
ncbi:hypothetical protein DPMN_033319, partial [Dreissena polymorpha]